MGVDFLNVLSELAAWFGLNLLNLLETTGLNEGSLCLWLSWEDLGELGSYIGKDIIWSKLEEWFKSWQMGAHLDDVLEGFLGLVLEILRALWEHVDGEES